MKYKEYKSLVIADLNRGGGNFLRRLLVNPSFQIAFWYRTARYMMLTKNVLRFAAALIYRHYEHKYGVGISLSQEIGRGLCIAHYSGIFISAKKVGNNLTIYQGCTIGSVHGKGIPTVGDNVLMYAGSKVVGNIKIGNNVVIGANAVVIHDVPDNAVVVGVPGRVVSYNATNITQYQNYS